MGDDASERVATDDEIAEMQVLVREGRCATVRSGSCRRSSTSMWQMTVGVPSNHAAPEELVALAGVLAEERRAPSSTAYTFPPGYTDEDREPIRLWPRHRAGRCTPTPSP